MAINSDDLVDLIKEALPDAHVEIQDLRGDGDHYAATITSKAFKHKTRIQQHQMVYKALGSRMGGTLHALSIKTVARDS